MSIIALEIKQEIMAKVKAGEEVKKVAVQYGVSAPPNFPGLSGITPIPFILVATTYPNLPL